jgi:predicted signal transduction protein with EAL and GGDEF domain
MMRDGTDGRQPESHGDRGIVETESAAKAPQEMGCDYGQGYYFSEPIEADLALQQLRTQHPFHTPARRNRQPKKFVHWRKTIRQRS